MEHSKNQGDQMDQGGGSDRTAPDVRPGDGLSGADSGRTDDVAIGNSPARPLWPTIVAGLVWAGVIAFLFVIAMQRS